MRVCQVVLWVLVVKFFVLLIFYSFTGHEQILFARQDEFRLASLLAELQQFPVFNVQQFEAAIDSIRTCVAEVYRRLFLTVVLFFHCLQRLWKLVVEDSNLIGHLHVRVFASCVNNCFVVCSVL